MKRGIMPSFSNNNLDKIDTPFIDPLDAEENIRSLNTETSSEFRTEVDSF